MRTDTMSLETCSPNRTPASKRCRGDIDQPALQVDLNFDVGIFREGLRQSLGQENCDSGMIARGDSNCAGGLFTQVVQRRQFEFHLLEARAHGSKQTLAGLRR